MLSDLFHDLEEEIRYHFSPLKNGYVLLGAGVGMLVCVRYYLSSRYAKCRNTVSLAGKTCIVTGATSGIGQAVAKEMARRNANVIIACRNVQMGSETALMIRKSIPYPVNISVYNLDLASLDSVRKFAFEINKESIDVDVLINNAGIFGAPFTRSDDNYELHFATNHLGHFLLTGLLLPRMKNKPDARIITVSSSLYKRITAPDFRNFNEETGYNQFNAYASSKLANIMFTTELSKKLPKGKPLVELYMAFLIRENRQMK